MSAFREALFAQPANLEAAAQAFAEQVNAGDLSRLGNGTILLSGIGASASALIPAVLALRAAGRRAFAVSSAELTAPGLADAYVLVSQSGASTETVAALDALHGAPVVAVSARGDSPLAAAAELRVPLGPRPDTPVATLSYTATLQALGMLCDVVVHGRVSDTWARLPDLAADVLARCDGPAAQVAQAFVDVGAVDAAGSGSALASALETALLAREGLRLPATGMETRTYLHGPLEAVGPGMGVVLFGSGRELALADTVRGYGAEVALITDADVTGPGVLAIPEVPALSRAILEILPAQLMTEHLARLLGLPIGELRRHQDDTKVAA